MPVSVVTGGTGGIGRGVALGLARAGHQVVVIGRNRDRAEAALAWIAAQCPAAALELVVADLASLAETRAAGLQIAARHPAIAVLVNNAGMFATRRDPTAEGHDRVLAVNHLAPFVLTRTLLGALQVAGRSGGARIVNVGSSTSDRAGIDPADLEGCRRWGMVHSYGQSKLALLMTTLGWAERLRGTGVVANVVHPGTVATGLVREGGPIGLAWRLMAPFVLTQAAGADTPLHVALSPDFATVTGAYVKRRRVVTANRLAGDAALVAQVWRATEALAGLQVGRRRPLAGT